MLRYVATLLPTRRNFGALLIDRKHSGGCYRMPIINALVRDLQCETTMATLTKPCCVPSLITAHEINMPIECCSTVHITSKSTVNKLRLSGRGMMMQHAEGKLKNLVEFVERINFLASTHKCINIHLLQLIGECASICSACIAGADKHDHETYARLYSVIHSLKNSPSSTYLRDVGSIIENSDDSLISNELREAKAIADSAFNVMISTWMKKEASYYESFCSISGNDRNSMKQLRALNDLLDREYQAQIKMSARLAQQSSLVLADVNDLLKLLYPNKGIAAVITPFGSRYNGLGSLSSDLDLSVSFYRGTERIPVLLPARRKQLQQNLQQIPGALKAANILREIRYALQKSRQFRFVDMVLSSRVPIIKLEHCRTKMQVLMRHFLISPLPLFLSNLCCIVGHCRR